MMRKQRTVVVILLAVALLVIAAACGRDEASPETADLNALASEQVVSAHEEAREEPTDLSGEQGARQEVDRNDSPTPDLTHGSPLPPPSSGSPLAPLPSLKFGDVNYVYGGSAERPSGEGAEFVINGIEINLARIHRGRAFG